MGRAGWAARSRSAYSARIGSRHLGEAGECGPEHGSRGILSQAALAGQREPVVSFPPLGRQPGVAEDGEVVDWRVHGRVLQRVAQLVTGTAPEVDDQARACVIDAAKQVTDRASAGAFTVGR